MDKHSSKPISEGAFYGPAPPPALDASPESARWLMEGEDAARNDPSLYQYLWLRDRLDADFADKSPWLSDETYAATRKNLDESINKRRAELNLPEVRLQLPKNKPFRTPNE